MEILDEDNKTSKPILPLTKNIKPVRTKIKPVKLPIIKPVRLKHPDEDSYELYLKSQYPHGRTPQNYLFYYRKFKERGLDISKKDDIIIFLTSIGKTKIMNNPISRAFLRSYAEYLEIDDIKIPKMRGRRKKSQHIYI